MTIDCSSGLHVTSTSATSLLPTLQSRSSAFTPTAGKVPHVHPVISLIR